jgi:hypothetical protein
MKCANGKYKYGANGSCVYDTLAACKAAAAAIHIDTPSGPRQAVKDMPPVDTLIVPTPCDSTSEDVNDMLLAQYK